MTRIGVAAMAAGLLATGAAAQQAPAEPPSRTPEQRALDALGRWGFRRLGSEMQAPASDVTLTATAVGCRWRYAYGGAGGAGFDPGATPCAGALCRLGLEAERAAPVPVGTIVRIVAQGTDAPRVLDVPQIGLRVEATPGRPHEAWVSIKAEGVYPGMLDAACAKDPAAIAPALRALARPAFEAWLKQRQRSR